MVAMPLMRVVQVARDEVIDVVAVRHRFVPAAGAVNVSRLVPAAGVAGGAGLGIGRGDGQHMLLDHSARGGVVEVAVVQVIDMAVVLNGRVPAAGAVNVVVIGVGVHGDAPKNKGGTV
jgi:hypothetical protein